MVQQKSDFGSNDVKIPSVFEEKQICFELYQKFFPLTMIEDKNKHTNVENVHD